MNGINECEIDETLSPQRSWMRALTMEERHRVATTSSFIHINHHFVHIFMHYASSHNTCMCFVLVCETKYGITFCLFQTDNNNKQNSRRAY